MILPSAVRSGMTPKSFLRAAVGEPEAGHHFVVDQQRAVLLREPRSSQELRRRRHEAHVADDRFEDHAGDLVARRGERFGERGDVVVRAARACRAVQPCGTPGLFGTPSVSALDAGRDEQAIDVAVIAAGELDDRRRGR